MPKLICYSQKCALTLFHNRAIAMSRILPVSGVYLARLISETLSALRQKISELWAEPEIINRELMSRAKSTQRLHAAHSDNDSALPSLPPKNNYCLTG